MQTSFHHIHRHIRQHHKKYLLGTAIGGVGFFMIKVFVFIIGFFGLLQHPGTFASGGPACGDWDNSQFLTGSFRDSAPDNNKIICALLGDGNGNTNRTAYTSTRNTVSCNIANMVVTGVTPGTDTLPANLAANTIYVLESGTYITTDTRNMATCSAIVGKGTVEIKGDFATNARLLQSASKNNWIVDNLSLNRNRGTNIGTAVDVMGVAGSSSLTVNTIKAYSGYVGINMYSASNYVTVNNSESYDNSSYGIYLYNSMSYGKINNCSVHNNSDYGIVFNLAANSGQVNNSQVYNNSGGGIWSTNALYNQINNSQIYSNTGAGIYFSNNAQYGQIDTVQVYNNTSMGIYGYNVTNLTVNNTKSYNNSHGIYLYSSATTPPPNNSIINNSQTYNNTVYGITLRNASYVQINTSQSYNNNNYGILMYKANNTQINNSQSYNNSAYGIYLQLSNYLCINNSQIYNNSTYGLGFWNNSSYSLINNSAIYNNGASGIYMYSGSNNIVYNSNMYNNIGYGIFITAASINNIYYGTNKTFGNTTDAIGGTILNLAQGTDGFMGRSNGSIDQTPIVSRDYITNPKNLSGEYLFPRTGTMATLRGRKASFGFDTGMQYSYGSGMFTQAQPIMYDGTTRVASGIYDINNYIGGNLPKNMGELMGSRGTYLGSTMMVTGTNGGMFTKYNIYGDIATPIFGIDNNTSTSLTLSGTLPTKTIIAQFYTPNISDSMHFQKNISDIGQVQILYTYPSSGTTITTLTGYTGLSIINNNGSDTYMRTGIDISGTDLSFTFIVQDMYGNTGSIPVRLWNNDIYLTDSFWNENPTANNIIGALLGDGSGGVDKTIYTSGRNTNTCNIANIVVTGVLPGTDTLPVTLAANTIYVLEPGTYITTATRNMATCSAIIGKGTVEIRGNFTTNTRLLSSSSKSNWILDNLNLNRNRGTNIGTSTEVLYTNNTPSITVNKIKAHDGYAGMYLNGGTNYATIDNSELYTNLGQGIVFATSNTGSINNSKIYNNISYGIYMYTTSKYISINNSQIYDNNNYGIFFGSASDFGSINNSQVYRNNGNGIHMVTNLSGQINNTQSYNNTGHGMYIQGCTYLQINTSKTYSNTSVGMYFYNNGNFGQINNSQSYNNGSYGMLFQTSSYGRINNSQSYNNANMGMYFVTTPNSSINNSQSYNNSSYGMVFATSSNGQINNSQSYNNNANGIYISTFNNAQINNSQSYNNNGAGVYLGTSNYSSINNSQIYNNSFGVQYSVSSNSGVIQNSQIYNQTNQGIYYSSGSNNIVHDSMIYNQHNGGSNAVYNLIGCTNNKYYGTIYMFGNASNIGGTAPQNFITGTDGLLGRSNGTIDQTPTMSRDYITNPVNTTNKYLFPRTGTMASLRGVMTNYVFDTGMQYSYGSGILTQVAPVVYSGTTLVTSGIYNANNYIGGDITKMTGDILGINQYNAVNVVVTGIGSLPISTYTIYGNIQNILGGIPINTSTTIQLTTGSATNTLIVQLYDPINYFATHFQKITTIDQTPPSAPILLSPTSGIQFNTGVNFLRSGAVDTGVGIGGYNYQVSTTSGFTNNTISNITTTTGISLTGFTDGLYYRRVAAYDGAGNTGTRSSVRNFSIETINPIITFTGSTPANNAWIKANSFTAQLDIIETNLSQFKRTRSGTQYSLYDSGLVVMYNLDKVAALGETDGMIKDFSQYGNNGSGYGGIVRTGNGRWNGAYIFNGTNYVNVPDNDVFTFSGPRTLSLMVNFASISAIKTVISKDDYQGGSINREWGGGLFVDGAFRFYLKGDLAGNIQIGRQTDAILQAGVWYNIVIVYNGGTTNASIKLYVNGVQSDTTDSSAGTFVAPVNGNQPIRIGTRGTSPVDGMNGRIDEVRIYNRALSTGEIALLYNSNLNKYDTDKWNFTVNITGVTTDGLFGYSGYVSDLANNTASTGRNIGRDTTSPSVPTLLSPTSGSQLNTGTVTLLRNTATDTGAGISGYTYQVSRNIGFTDIVISENKITTGVSLVNFTDGTYYRRVAAYDSAGNTGSRSATRNFGISTAVAVPAPIVGTGYIFAGTTGNNNGTLYYVGTVTSRAYLSGSAITSCEYSTGGGRSAATIGSNYCEIANQNFGSDIVLRFRATNEGGTTTGVSTTYIYDATPPSGGSFTIHANATYTTGTNVFLTTTCATDTGINGLQVAFGSSASPTNRQSCSSSIARTLPTGDGTKIVYMRFKDGLGNITTDTTDSILLDASGPAAPVVISPISGVVLSTGNIQLLRSGSLDAGIGTSGYVWQVSTGNTFVTLLTGGTTSSTGINLLALSATTYYRRVYAVDQLNNTGARSATGYFSISSAINFDIAAPTTLNIGNISVPENTQVIEKVFTGTTTYFTIADYVGDDQGYYTTLSMTNLTDGQGHIVSNANIAIKTATSIQTLSGSSNPNVVTSITGSYIHFGNNVLTFIKRDAGTNNGVKGVYGVAPALQVTIPELQTPGNYSGTLIYTFYPN